MTETENKMKKGSSNVDSRRQFLESTAVGAIGVSSGIFCPSVLARKAGAMLGELSIESDQSITIGSPSRLHLRFKGNVDLVVGAKLWLFFDFRQGAARPQTNDAQAENFFSIRVAGKNEHVGDVHIPHIPRTFDLLPIAPEFLHMVQVTLNRHVDKGKNLDFVIERWNGPQHPIQSYRFWLVVDHAAEWDFPKTGYRRYYHFVSRHDKTRMPTDELFSRMLTTTLQVTGQYQPVPRISHRKTPGIYWGEFHGMVFNQRPLDDYYNYAKQVTKLDFCAPFGFSYNTSVGNVWDEVKAAAKRHTQPGKFIAIPGFECGTPPEGSHRCVLFRDADGVPPILCEHRDPAREKLFLDRLHPDTIICKTVAELYDTVERYGGMITGHYHTREYHAEVLCEMFQKNLTKPVDEEQRLYELLRSGKRFALAGTSDTHDSMPGNPWPEPHLPMAAGFTGVHADELSIDAVFDAVLARRIYATSGARIVMRFQSNGKMMGSELPLDAKRSFQLDVDGTTRLQSVELLRNGHPIQKWTPNSNAFAGAAEDTDVDRSKSAFYILRVKQSDEHQGWTSPIWFG